MLFLLRYFQCNTDRRLERRMDNFGKAERGEPMDREMPALRSSDRHCACLTTKPIYRSSASFVPSSSADDNCLYPNRARY